MGPEVTETMFDRVIGLPWRVDGLSIRGGAGGAQVCLGHACAASRHASAE